MKVNNNRFRASTTIASVICICALILTATSCNEEPPPPPPPVDPTPCLDGTSEFVMIFEGVMPDYQTVEIIQTGEIIPAYFTYDKTKRFWHRKLPVPEGITSASYAFGDLRSSDTLHLNFAQKWMPPKGDCPEYEGLAELKVVSPTTFSEVYISTKYFAHRFSIIVHKSIFGEHGPPK